METWLDSDHRTRTGELIEMRVEVSDLCYRYRRGDFCLMVDRLLVDSGGALAVVGPSGSGKTTLLHLIAGVLTPDHGLVRIGEVELSAESEKARREFRLCRLGLIFQSFELLSHLNVVDNILLPCRMTHLTRLTGEIRDRAGELAERMGIASKFKDHVANLSQGERQRVAICRALLLDPDVLLCDEPTGNLDPANKQRVLDTLLDVVRQNGTTMIMVTHDHQLLDQFDETVQTSDWVPSSIQAPAQSSPST